LYLVQLSSLTQKLLQWFSFPGASIRRSGLGIVSRIEGNEQGPDGIPFADRHSAQPDAVSPWVRLCVQITVLSCLSAAANADDTDAKPFLAARTLHAHDSLNCGTDANTDAQACLAGLSWRASDFDVEIQNAIPDRGDALIRFPSPVTTGNALNDQVAMEWYVVRDDSGAPINAPAVVVVHESGRRMTAGRLFARGFRQRGLHAFLLHLPDYGVRRDEARPRDADNVVDSIRQAVADVRRARDAVAVLPAIDAANVSLQGTSLGGFISATTAGLDHGYQAIFLMLAGGNLFDVLQNGQRDAAKVRKRLEAAGLTGESLRTLVYQIEPNRLAHRYDARRTWLYSGTHDTVVPLRSAESLARAAGLTTTHHIRMNANHYSGIIYLPFVLNHMAGKIGELSQRSERP
jgi:dienelactone hydrolase